MEPLFEPIREQYFDIPCKLVKDYDGKDILPFIKELIVENQVLFGGSSLIHDLYFPTQFWLRDYDLWCVNDAYKKIRRKLGRMRNCKKVKDVSFEIKSDYYGRFKTEAISEYYCNLEVINDGYRNIQQIKLQLINVGKTTSQLFNAMRFVDLSFNSLFYDGSRLIFVDTTEEEIKSKIGYFIPLKKNIYSHCDCIYCTNNGKLSEKELSRVRKYKERGFQILNLCPLCDSTHYSSLFHSMECLKRKLRLTDRDFYKMGDSITEEMENELSNVIYRYENTSIICAALLLFLSKRCLPTFSEKFEKCKHLIDTRSSIYNEVLKYCVEKGSLSGFSSFFGIVESQLTPFANKRICQLFEIASKKNFINIARFIANKSPRFKLEIFEDKIISFKFQNIFEYFLETNDRQQLIQEYSKINFINSPSEDPCPICHTSEPNLILHCKHRFCDSCLIMYFAIETRSKKELSCPLCRSAM